MNKKIDRSYKILSRLFFIFIMNVIITHVTAQNISFSGRVTNTMREPLPGVSVKIKGTTTGAITDLYGKFSISYLSKDAILVFSFVGMKTQEVKVTGNTTVNVIMEEETIGLQEVVAIGYGTMKKSDLTGSVASVKSDVINAIPVSTIVQSLQGRVAGVHITQNTGQPGSSLQVRIRGTNSIKGDNSPLWIIDGFPGDPNSISSSDIESIDVLKDASATAIYGSRGANGVIIVTTKRGKAGQTKVDYEGSYSLQSLQKKLPLMNAEEYMIFNNIQQKNDVGKEYFTKEQIQNAGKGTDWQDLMFRTAPMNDHSINVSGGNEKTRFYFGGNYLSQEGILNNNGGYQRYSVRANVNHDISKMFSLSYNILLTRTENDRKGTLYGEYGEWGIFRTILDAPPTFSPYNADGTYANSKALYPFIGDNQYNVLMFVNETTNKLRTNSVMANISLEFKPIKNLSVKMSGNVSNNDNREDYYQTTRYISSSGNAQITSTQGLSLNSDNIISYHTMIKNNHDISVTGAVTYEESSVTSFGTSGSGFISDLYETHNIGAAATVRPPSSSYMKWSLFSYLGRLNYSYKNKYLLTASFRSDGSSRYSEGNKWGYFPSGALAWRISEEGFLNDVPFLSNLKLRAGYGETGSTAISPYSTMSLLYTGKVVLNKADYTYFAPSTTYPGNLKWETTTQTDIGIDAGFFNNRLTITGDYYIKNTRDLLNDVQMPASSGYNSTIKNIGEIQNKGFEFQVDANILNSKLKWDVSANISFNRNKVVKLYNGQDIFGSAVGLQSSDYINIIREGKPIGLFYGYLEDGLDANGSVKYKDLKEDGIINASDKTVIGDPTPDFIYGINSILSYKNFEFSFYFQGSHGNDIFCKSIFFKNYYYGYGVNAFRDVLFNHWTPQNTDAEYPKISKSVYTSQKLSDRFVYDGSYLKLRNIQLAYNIPDKLFGAKWLRSGQVYVSAQSLFTITSYPWVDPDVNSLGGGASLNQGVDNFTYPTTKGFTFGIKLGF